MYVNMSVNNGIRLIENIDADIKVLKKLISIARHEKNNYDSVHAQPNEYYTEILKRYECILKQYESFKRDIHNSITPIREDVLKELGVCVSTPYKKYDYELTRIADIISHTNRLRNIIRSHIIKQANNETPVYSRQLDAPVCDVLRQLTTEDRDIRRKKQMLHNTVNEVLGNEYVDIYVPDEVRDHFDFLERIIKAEAIKYSKSIGCNTFLDKIKNFFKVQK